MYILIKILLFLFFISPSYSIAEEKIIKIAIMPTFSAHQHIGYEVIERLKKQGIIVETVVITSSTEGNNLLLNGQIDINVGSITSFILLDNKRADQGVLLSSIGHYTYFLLCTPDINSINDVLKTNIVTSARNTTEHHTIRWLAKKYFRDPYAFEKNFITMPRPQIYQIMKAGSKDIKCAMTGMPLQNQLEDELGLKVIEQSDINTGIAGSYNAYWTSKDFAMKNPKLIEIFVKNTVEVINEFNEDPKIILEKFIEKDLLKFDVSYLLENYKKNKAIFHYDLRGAEYYNDFLHEIEHIKGNKNKLSTTVFNLDLLK
jgi:ABC-type nitrate/sulfonate/bicarbonate transport system substrate-binding protein